MSWERVDFQLSTSIWRFVEMSALIIKYFYCHARKRRFVCKLLVADGRHYLKSLGSNAMVYWYHMLLRSVHR